MSRAVPSATRLDPPAALTAVERAIVAAIVSAIVKNLRAQSSPLARQPVA